jgi:putative transposase
MISRDKNLPNVVVRDMQALSHYKFKLRLKHLANVHNKCVIDCSEKYTSVTCTNCGNLHQNLNANKIYNCVKCQKTFDRDINAARNILIKNITHLFD